MAAVLSSRGPRAPLYKRVVWSECTPPERQITTPPPLPRGLPPSQPFPRDQTTSPPIPWAALYSDDASPRRWGGHSQRSGSREDPIDKLRALLAQPTPQSFSRLLRAPLAPRTSFEPPSPASSKVVRRPRAGVQASLRRMERNSRREGGIALELLRACVSTTSAPLLLGSPSHLTSPSRLASPSSDPGYCRAPATREQMEDLTSTPDRGAGLSTQGTRPHSPEKAGEILSHRSGVEWGGGGGGGATQPNEASGSHHAVEMRNEGCCRPDAFDDEGKERPDATMLARQLYANICNGERLHSASFAPQQEIAKLLFNLPLFRGSAPVHRCARAPRVERTMDR